jgi:hypothetical protein
MNADRRTPPKHIMFTLNKEMPDEMLVKWAYAIQLEL